MSLQFYMMSFLSPQILLADRYRYEMVAEQALIAGCNGRSLITKVISYRVRALWTNRTYKSKIRWLSLLRHMKDCRPSERNRTDWGRESSLEESEWFPLSRRRPTVCSRDIGLGANGRPLGSTYMTDHRIWRSYRRPPKRRPDSNCWTSTAATLSSRTAARSWILLNSWAKTGWPALSAPIEWALDSTWLVSTAVTGAWGQRLMSTGHGIDRESGWPKRWLKHPKRQNLSKVTPLSIGCSNCGNKSRVLSAEWVRSRVGIPQKTSLWLMAQNILESPIASQIVCTHWSRVASLAISSVRVSHLCNWRESTIAQWLVHCGSILGSLDDRLLSATSLLASRSLRDWLMAHPICDMRAIDLISILDSLN